MPVSPSHRTRPRNNRGVTPSPRVVPGDGTERYASAGLWMLLHCHCQSRLRKCLHPAGAGTELRCFPTTGLIASMAFHLRPAYFPFCCSVPSPNPEACAFLLPSQFALSGYALHPGHLASSPSHSTTALQGFAPSQVLELAWSTRYGHGSLLPDWVFLTGERS